MGMPRLSPVIANSPLQSRSIPPSLAISLSAVVANHKKSISALQLQKDLGLGSYRTAWRLLQKIRRCFDENADNPLRGIVEVDETLI